MPEYKLIPNECGDGFRLIAERSKPSPWRDPLSLLNPAGVYGDTLDAVVYVIRYNSLVKIGSAKDLNRRFGELQRMIPEPIELVTSFPGGQVLERYLHKHFAAHRFRNEWFRVEGALEAWIRNGCPSARLLRRAVRKVLEKEKQRRDRMAGGAVPKNHYVKRRLTP